jgi:uncharacterized membrane-anchored protein
VGEGGIIVKKAIFVTVAVVIFGVTNGLIAHKEYILQNGTTMLLKLAPVDPRSLIQGDYMILAYAMEREASRRASRDIPLSGELVVKADSAGIAQFVRFHKGEQLAADEHLLHYRWGMRAGQGLSPFIWFLVRGGRQGELRIGANAFFFQEGHAKYYEKAKYGELKVSPGGGSVLVGLRDKNLHRLAPQPHEKRNH